MIISREAAIEAMKRFGQSYDDISVDRVVRGKMDISGHELAKAIQELWDACPEKCPVDNRVIAMRVALNETGLMKCDNGTAGIVLEKFNTKLAELDGRK